MAMSMGNFAIRIKMPTKCPHTAETLLRIYERYKELSARIITKASVHKSFNLEEAEQPFKALLNAFDGYDLCDLTVEQAQRLGMAPFEDFESRLDTDFLMLFPLWMFPIIPTDVELTNIFEIKLPPFENRQLVDTSTIDGMLTYGMMNYQFRYKGVIVEKTPARR